MHLFAFNLGDVYRLNCEHQQAYVLLEQLTAGTNDMFFWKWTPKYCDRNGEQENNTANIILLLEASICTLTKSATIVSDTITTQPPLANFITTSYGPDFCKQATGRLY